ncbi:MAG: ribonuclease P [Thermoplasmata archaeon]|nr:ribonuclease P [Thermoplasmata archaeon]
MRPNRFERAKNKRRTIAKERIILLLDMAEQRALADEMPLADRYAQLARKIGMRYQISMPRGFNLRFCRQCLKYLVPGKNARFRTSAGRLSRQCLGCSSIYRMPLKPRRI